MIEVSFTMLLQWLNFGILLFLLTFFLFKPILGALDKRRELIKGQIDGAKQKNEEAEEVLKEYQERLNNLKLEGRKIIDEARKEAVLEKDKILDAASAEAKLILENAQLELETHVKTVQEDLKKHTAELVVNCATQVLEREINEKDHQKYIDEFIESAK